MERRRESRYPFFATVELLETRGSVKIQARTGDLSLHGCYIDTMNPFPAGSKVRVTITHEHDTFVALGIIAHSQVNVGMGISFTEVEQQHKEILSEWLSALHGN